MRPTYAAARSGSSPTIAVLLALAPLAPLAHGPAVAAEAGMSPVPYTVTDAARIDHSLTGHPGDPAAGAALYADRARTGCAECHEAGRAPPLVAGELPRDAGVLRLWLVAPEVRDPALAFHSHYRAGQRDDPQDPQHGGPLLTAAEIEDLVAWLAVRAAGR